MNTPLGQVTLVGAGPGDPELLTLKAARAIQAASVILVDDLVGEGVLAHARPEARITYVGKRGGCKSTPQATIEQLMLDAARAGENVVRLKGGDPFIFGRGGEEVESLRRAGIEPWAWVINTSVAAASTTSPLLRQRAANELREINAVANEHADRYAVVPLLKEEPIGAERLRALIHPQA